MTSGLVTKPNSAHAQKASNPSVVILFHREVYRYFTHVPQVTVNKFYILVPPPKYTVTNTTAQERDKAMRKLDDLATWSPEDLDEELSTWTPEAVTNLWNLLETSYRRMCRCFGLASSRQRMSARGVRTHQQIKRLIVLQRHAQRGAPQ